MMGFTLLPIVSLVVPLFQLPPSVLCMLKRRHQAGRVSLHLFLLLPLLPERGSPEQRQ